MHVMKRMLDQGHHNKGLLCTPSPSIHTAYPDAANKFIWYKTYSMQNIQKQAEWFMLSCIC